MERVHTTFITMDTMARWTRRDPPLFAFIVNIVFIVLIVIAEGPFLPQ